MRCGFTLIKLLVAIDIIVRLAAILFPAFARAREKARQTSWLNNVKHLALGVMMYINDYNDTMLHERYYIPNETSLYTVAQPYIQNRQILSCPNQPETSIACG